MNTPEDSIYTICLLSTFQISYPRTIFLLFTFQIPLVCVCDIRPFTAHPQLQAKPHSANDSAANDRIVE